MRVLIAGGGVIARGVIPELQTRGHDVRAWPAEPDLDVEPWDGAEAVDAVLQLDAACEVPAAERVIRIDSDGRAGVPPASRGTSRAADVRPDGTYVRWRAGRPLAIRTDVVYGPGDEVIAALLKKMRTLPVVPVPDGDKPFRPLWYRDAGKALARMLEGADPVDLAGPETTTLNDVVRRLRHILDRHPLAVPVPFAHKVPDAPENAPALPGIELTPLDEGLRMLADMLPEVLPEDGVGTMERKKFWADISGTRYDAAALMTLFRERITDVMPIEFAAEPGVPRRVELGVTLTAHLPLRGNIQVRAVELDRTRVVFATVEGHPLAGIVEFSAEDAGSAVRFRVDVSARAATLLDFVALHTVGKPAQTANWRAVVQKMIDLSGGTSDGVHQEAAKLDDAEAAEVEARVRRLVQRNTRLNADRAAL
jgi:NADH dehydrogenase